MITNQCAFSHDNNYIYENISPRSGSLLKPKSYSLGFRQYIFNVLKGQLKKITMSQSLSQLYVHIVFHIKYNSGIIRKQEKVQLYAYMASIIKDNQSIPILINGVENHVHILCIMSKNIALARLVEKIKRHSSRWIKTKDPHYAKFAWQGGYGGFSVSSSLRDKTKNYIAKQEAHHKKMNFKEEYLLFLKEYGIEYNEEYLWRD